MDSFVKKIQGTERRRLLAGHSVLAGLFSLTLVVIVLRSGAAAGLSGQEIDLKNAGQAWELNLDQNGHFWISDYGASEIWHLNPATEVYTSYRGLDGASDGRLDANGDLWWSDFDNHRFGRLELDSAMGTTWPLTGVLPGEASGVNFDDQGRVWVTDRAYNNLYRFDPQSDEFCHFSLPNSSRSQYIVAHDGYLWLADWNLPHILRVDPDAGTYVDWFYKRASGSRGMTFDDQGNLWWGGYDKRSALFRLDPGTNWVTYFTLPGNMGLPAMVDAHHNAIWYSDETGYFGHLIPQLASGTAVFTDRTSGDLPVTCYKDWQPDSSGHVANSTTSASWAAGTYSVTANADGWQLVQLPEGSDPEFGPWGIRVRGDGVWVIDQDRQKLVHMPRVKLYIPAVRN